MSWPGDIYSPAGSAGGLWATDGGHDVLWLTPDNLSGCDACAQADLVHVSGDAESVISTSRGLFVSASGGPQSAGHTYFWSWHDLDDTLDQPTARVGYGGSLAGDGPGVVIGAGQAGIIHWVPKG